MPYRMIPFVPNELYHIFNRGVAKMPIFEDDLDRKRFLKTLHYYQFKGPKPQFSHLKRNRNVHVQSNQKIVEILVFCFMPNHFHLVLKELLPNGISEFMNKVGNSYTKYYNTRHQRVGPLLQGQFKAVHVDSDEQLVHLSRYIHLNPIKAFLTRDLENYPWSSYLKYLGISSSQFCNSSLILTLFKNSNDYKQFVLDQADYARNLNLIEGIVLE